MVTCDCQAKPSTTPQIDNDVWIEWGGTEDACAEPVDGTIHVKFRDGAEGKGFAHTFFWNHDGIDSDIIAYRVIENDGREG